MAAPAPVLALFSEPKSLSRKQKKKLPGFSILHSLQRTRLCVSLSAKSSASARISATTLFREELTTRDLDGEIQELCQKGELEAAMDTISLLHYTEFSSLDSQTYCHALQLCSDHESLSHGKKLHSLISFAGIEIDSDLAAKLVSMYVNCGELGEGRKVFDGLAANNNHFLWNLLMSKYSKIGDFMEVLLLFQKLWESGVNPNSRTFSCVLKCLSILGHLRSGMTVHGYLQKLDLFNNGSAVGNALISLYSKCGCVDTAVQVFDKMPVKDIISWNTIIHGCVLNDLLNKGIELFYKMLFSGVDMDAATLVSILPAFAEIGALDQGRALHGYTIKAGFVKEVTVNNSLLDMYSKCLSIQNSEQIFRKMSEKTIVSWTSMISGYTVNGRYEEAIALFEELEAEEGIEPDLHFITSALHACACGKSWNRGSYIHDYVFRNGLESHTFVANALMDMYAKCGDMENARFVFKHMSSKDVVSWNTLIGGYAKNSLPNEALYLFVKMRPRVRPNSTTMACALRALASLSSLEKGREMHAHIVRAGFQECIFVRNALVDMYAKSGALMLARKLFDLTDGRDLVSWTVMIAGYGMHGRGGEALAIFKLMRKEGINPDRVSFIAILYACSHSGLIDEGWRFFNVMRNEYKIEPLIEHYACMVDLLSRAGRLSKAYKFIESMPMEPDSTVWGALLSGCRIHRDVKLAEKVAERVFELEPENTGYYILLANIYADAEKWEAVRKMRERIRSKALRKHPGCSWIEVKGKVHIFVSGSNSNSQSRNIKKLLEGVRKRMKEEGRVPERRYALINAEDGEKEEALCGHSEKLAIAFGVLNATEGKPIRVAKNLRVCGDCHEVAKFISYMTGREIILRDRTKTNRSEQIEAHFSTVASETSLREQV
ncbi:Pentatricopeptide repeat-containing protein [Platanthera zijinensis]|uniref:Pentatricopeptide repeat-containing protein n=1 Tax=Platanthera zijinensis TaxID=2320716 RepID=A0AAP0BEA6_9ASPA